ncbi:MAG TPA: bifunctional alpha,alpha-trehalose-phosphate synthase (UDP-forming)/trehalose-phosphatase [Bacteroidia bacterium]
MRIINISYRLPISFKKKGDKIELKTTDGGLATAISSLKSEDNELLWTGVADFSRSDYENGKSQAKEVYKIKPIFIEKSLNNGFYKGFSNAVIWPLFHYFPSFVEFNDDHFQNYIDANQQISDQIATFGKEDDVYWIHDYQLIPLAGMLRKVFPNAKIGFFLHIPFPSFELIRLIPKYARNYLLNGFLGADLIGFHTHEYAIHFLNSIQMSEGIRHKQYELRFKHRNIKIGVFPISIDFEKFNSSFDNDIVIKQREELKELNKGKKTIFSVDRLDYTKGIVYRLKGYKKFLELHPEWRGQIVFQLVAVPSRTDIFRYIERKQMIELLISEINGVYGSMSWTPIVYQYSQLKYHEMLGLYTNCDIALISPLRDGMNLVSKEFVASRKDLNGVLLLSDLTGAAKELTDALLFNPLDENEIAEKIHQALIMEPEEQQLRMSRMQKQIKQFDIHFWGKSFIQQLISSTFHHNQPKKLDFQERNKLLNSYQNAQKRLILLDYDGTLTGFKSNPEMAIPESEILEIINGLTKQKGNQVAIVSGRKKETLDEWFGKLPVVLIAEHGAYVKRSHWKACITGKPQWMDGVKEILNVYAESCEGSFIEEKSFSIGWHYRNCREEIGFAQSRDLLKTLDRYLTDCNATIVDGNKIVEIKPIQFNKGQTVLMAFDISEFDFILAIGDDKTDEDMFDALNPYGAFSIKVGKSSSNALYRLETIQMVISMLQIFSKLNVSSI